MSATENTEQIAVARHTSEETKTLFQRVKGNRSLVIGGTLLVTVLAFFLICQLFGNLDASTTVAQERLQSPSAEHLFGTDNYGRDLLSRVVAGGWTSLILGFIVALVTGILGTFVGLISSYFSWLDQVLMRISDGMMSIPAILFAVALTAVLGPAMQNLIIALSVVYTPVVARVVRSRALSVKSETFVSAALAGGGGSAYVIRRHLLPNTFSVLFVQVAFIFADAIIVEAALSFLGAGVPPPSPSWGNILYDGKGVLVQAPHMVLFTSVLLVIAVLALNLIGDGMRDLVDSRESVGPTRRSFKAKKPVRGY